MEYEKTPQTVFCPASILGEVCDLRAELTACGGDAYKCTLPNGLNEKMKRAFAVMVEKDPKFRSSPEAAKIVRESLLKGLEY